MGFELSEAGRSHPASRGSLTKVVFRRSLPLLSQTMKASSWCPWRRSLEKNSCSKCSRTPRRFCVCRFSLFLFLSLSFSASPVWSLPSPLCISLSFCVTQKSIFLPPFARAFGGITECTVFLHATATCLYLSLIPLPTPGGQKKRPVAGEGEGGKTV